MGKPNPTDRTHIETFADDRQPYRDWLRSDDQPHFDQLGDHARDHADTGGAQNPVGPE